MTLREAKQIIRQEICTWSDDFLARVYAFNQDGKMTYGCTCGCLIGVLSSEALGIRMHDRSFDYRCATFESHYDQYKRDRVASIAIEFAYRDLVNMNSLEYWIQDELRRTRFSAMLRWELRRREAAKRVSVEELEYAYVRK